MSGDAELTYTDKKNVVMFSFGTGKICTGTVYLLCLYFVLHHLCIRLLLQCVAYLSYNIC